MSLSENNIWWPFGRFMIFLILIISIFSCGRKKSDQKKTFTKNKNVFNEQLFVNRSFGEGLLKEAKYFDVPVPVGYKFVRSKKEEFPKNQDTDYLCYSGGLPLEKVVDYYHKNMELNGWQISDFSTKQEGLLFCNKQNKDCIISIRENNTKRKKVLSKNLVCLFIKNRLHVQNKQKDINSKKLPVF